MKKQKQKQKEFHELRELEKELLNEYREITLSLFKDLKEAYWYIKMYYVAGIVLGLGFGITLGYILFT